MGSGPVWLIVRLDTMGLAQQFRATIPLLSALLLALLPAARPWAWDLVYKGGGIRVSERPYHGSPVNELRGERVLDATLGEVMALLRDADYNARWVYRSGGARIIAQEGRSKGLGLRHRRRALADGRSRYGGAF